MSDSVGQFEDVNQVSEYVTYRPKYPLQVFHTVINYVKELNTPGTSGRFPLAIDVGCGPGITSTSFLAPYFDRVLGVDVSKAQIEQAKVLNEHANIEYRKAQAYCMPVEDNSVTLVQAASTIHWLERDNFYKECDRVLAPRGVFAAFTYRPISLKIVGHPQAAAMNEIVNEIQGRIFSKENPGYTEVVQMALKLYRDDLLKIPYEDKKWVDDIYVEVPTTISGFEKFYFTFTFAFPFLNSDEAIKSWWKNCMKRIMAAYGTDDPDAPLTYQMETPVLMGRKSKI